MERCKMMKKSCGWFRRFRDLAQEKNTAHAETETELPKTEALGAAARQETYNLETVQVGTEASAATEMFATAPSTTVSSASQTTRETPELRDLSSLLPEAVARIQELEDQIWEMNKSMKRIMEEMACQVTEFSKKIQAKNKLISELKEKLGFEDDKIEDGLKEKHENNE
jgi:predicted RNase H-like nuclease (RuvC/YqgF family)